MHEFQVAVTFNRTLLYLSSICPWCIFTRISICTAQQALRSERRGKSTHCTSWSLREYLLQRTLRFYFGCSAIFRNRFHLKEMAHKTDEATFRPWIQKLVQNPAVPANLRMALSLEVQGGSTSVHGALAAVTHPLSQGIEHTFMFAATLMCIIRTCSSSAVYVRRLRITSTPKLAIIWLTIAPLFVHLSRDAFSRKSFNKRRNLTPLTRNYSPIQCRDHDYRDR